MFLTSSPSPSSKRCGLTFRNNFGRLWLMSIFYQLESSPLDSFCHFVSHKFHEFSHFDQHAMLDPFKCCTVIHV